MCVCLCVCVCVQEEFSVKAYLYEAYLEYGEDSEEYQDLLRQKTDAESKEEEGWREGGRVKSDLNQLL